MGAFAVLIAVCLFQVSEGVHHERWHDNYYFRDFVCSNDNVPINPDSCGKIKDYFDQPRLPFGIKSIPGIIPPSYPPEVEDQLYEFYMLCCEEA